VPDLACIEHVLVTRRVDHGVDCPMGAGRVAVLDGALAALPADAITGVMEGRSRARSSGGAATSAG
jgi:hypothetical protein